MRYREGPTPRRESLPKNAEINPSWLDYKSALRVRTKVLKSLSKRPRASKPLNFWSLHRLSAIGSRLAVERTESRVPKAESLFLLCLQSSDVVDQVRNPLLHLGLMSLADA